MAPSLPLHCFLSFITFLFTLALSFTGIQLWASFYFHCCNKLVRNLTAKNRCPPPIPTRIRWKKKSKSCRPGGEERRRRFVRHGSVVSRRRWPRVLIPSEHLSTLNSQFPINSPKFKCQLHQFFKKGHGAMDKALACHTGCQGSNLDTTKFYSAPILSGTPACALSLSLTKPQAWILVTEQVKREESW